MQASVVPGAVSQGFSEQRPVPVPPSLPTQTLALWTLNGHTCSASPGAAPGRPAERACPRETSVWWGSPGPGHVAHEPAWRRRFAVSSFSRTCLTHFSKPASFPAASVGKSCVCVGWGRGSIGQDHASGQAKLVAQSEHPLQGPQPRNSRVRCPSGRRWPRRGGPGAASGGNGPRLEAVGF